MKGFQEKMCPRCKTGELKHWTELNTEEKILAERLPLSAEFTQRERAEHLFCPCCWFEQAENAAEIC